MTNGAWLLPKPTPWAKTLIVLLTLYAVLVIAPDTVRPFVSKPWAWYPIATLGFEANNDGRVTSVDRSGPAWGQGLRDDEEQEIDLLSVKPDSRPINKFLFVAHGRQYSFHVRNGVRPGFNATVDAVDENLSVAERNTLLLAQLSGFFFIGLCLFLVWRHASWPTWSLFLYAVFFNSGQYFVWYANLPTTALKIFDGLQALFQALALTGFLAFALCFPDDDVTGWRQAARPYLLTGTFVALFLFGGWGFMNFVAGWRTETPYRIYYALTLVVYVWVALLFWDTYRARPAHRPRMRWIVLGGAWGLLWFLMADTYEATTMLDPVADWLGRWVQPWLGSHAAMTRQAFLNLLYAQNVALPLAVVYTALHQRVMKVRFVVTRTVVSFMALTLSMWVVHELMTGFKEYLDQHVPWLEQYHLLVSGALTVPVTWIHNPLHGAVERAVSGRWHAAQRRLEAMAEHLMDDDDLELDGVNQRLVHDLGEALSLTSVALFRRQDDGSFVRETALRWREDVMRTLPPDDRILTSLTGVPLRLRDPDDEVEINAELDFSAPVLAAPVVIHHVVSRLLLLGPHNTGEDFDPDEMRVIRNVTRAAELAYRRLDVEAMRRDAGGDEGAVGLTGAGPA
jgi:hypothetical protein